MPRYIDNIWGHSPKTGRMYFRDSSGNALISSLDCKHFELTDRHEDIDDCRSTSYCANNLLDENDSGQAKNVPGFSMTGYPDATIQNYKGRIMSLCFLRINKFMIKMLKVNNIDICPITFQENSMDSTKMIN